MNQTTNKTSTIRAIVLYEICQWVEYLIDACSAGVFTGHHQASDYIQRVVVLEPER